MSLLGSAAGWPLTARAQQPTPVIGFLGASTPETNLERMRAFHLGLKETGYVEGDNVTILYRWAENQRIGCRTWQPIWLGGGSPYSPRTEMLPRWRQKQQRRRSRSSSPSPKTRSGPVLS